MSSGNEWTRRLEDVEARLDALEENMDALASEAGDAVVAHEESVVYELAEQFDALQDTVTTYLAQEKEVIHELAEQVADFGDLMRKAKQNQDRIAKLSDRVDAMEAQDVTQDDLDAVADELARVEDDLTGRIQKLETRVSALAQDEDSHAL